MPDRDDPVVSVVIPCFDEEDNVDALCARLVPVVRAMDVPAEIVLVDDGSSDRTLVLLLAARDENPEVVVVALARNFGQHAAVLAGFAAARGRHLVTLDADLQNPPEEIPRIVAEMEAGHDLVGTVRVDRRDSLFRRWASRAANAAMRRGSGIPLHDFGCMLRGYSREIAEQLVAQGETRTFIPALGYLYATRPVEIEVSHAVRDAGRSKYSLLRLFRLQLDLMTGFSLAPLRLLFSAGSAVALAGVALGVTLLVMRILHGSEWAAQGVFTLFAVLFVFVGAQFFALGILGEYVGRTLGVVRRRPTFVTRPLPPRERAPAPTGSKERLRERVG